MAKEQPKKSKPVVKELTTGDKLVLQSVSQAVAAVQQVAGDYMGSVAVERWGYAEGAGLHFTDFDLENGTVTVKEVEAKANVEKPAASSDEPTLSE